MPLEQNHWLPKNHLEVLEGHPERSNAYNSLIRRYYYPATWGFLTACGCVFHMFITRKPLLSGIHIQLASVAFGIAAGELYGKSKEKYYAEEEAQLKYYVQTHPELFPDYEMVKIGDILEPWYPIR